MSGIHAVIEPVAGMPQIASEPWPCCQTSSSTPQAAPTLSDVQQHRLGGSSSERNARASRTNVTSAISAIISGKLP